MNQKNEHKQNNDTQPMPRTVKQGFRAYVVAVLTLTTISLCSIAVLADPTGGATGGATDPLVVVNNLSNFIFGMIRAIGLIMLGFGIVQIGLSLKSHDPSQRANGMLTVAGGIIIVFAKEILTLITS